MSQEAAGVLILNILGASRLWFGVSRLGGYATFCDLCGLKLLEFSIARVITDNEGPSNRRSSIGSHGSYGCSLRAAVKSEPLAVSSVTWLVCHKGLSRGILARRLSKLADYESRLVLSPKSPECQRHYELGRVLLSSQDLPAASP